MTTELLTPGEIAPDFEAHDWTDNPVRLSDFQGRPIVLYFLRGFA